MPSIDTPAELDVQTRSIKAIALDIMTGEVRPAAFGYDHAALAE